MTGPVLKVVQILTHPISSTLQSRPYSNPCSQLRTRNPSREVLEPGFQPRHSGPRIHIPNCHTHRLYWEESLSHLGNREDWRSGKVSGWEPAGVEPRHLHSSAPRGRNHSQAVYSGRTVEATCKRWTTGGERAELASGGVFKARRVSGQEGEQPCACLLTWVYTHSSLKVPLPAPPPTLTHPPLASSREMYLIISK